MVCSLVEQKKEELGDRLSCKGKVWKVKLC